MRRGWQITSLGLLAISIVWLTQSLSFALSDALGPGPGFFPFWLSVTGAALAVLLFAEVTWAHADLPAERLLPSRDGGVRVLVILAGLAVATALLDPLGFRFTLLGFNAFMLVALGARSWWITALFAVMGSFGVFHVFYHWLKVPLPIGAFGI